MGSSSNGKIVVDGVDDYNSGLAGKLNLVAMKDLNEERNQP